jgi:hypothetical protein
MAIQRAYQEVSARNANTLTLAARPGSGRMVSRIGVAGATDGDYATIKNGPTTVGYFALGAGGQSHLAMYPNNVRGMNIFDVLKKYGLPYQIPIKEGDTLTVSFPTAASAVKIEYADVDPGDINPAAAFGRESTTGPMVLYGTNSAALAATGYIPINLSKMPTELTDFPWQINAEPGKTYVAHAIMAQDKAITTAVAGDYAQTTNLRLTKNREVLFDPNQNGFVTLGDLSNDGTATTTNNSGDNQLPLWGDDGQRMPFTLPAPVTFAPGDELLIEQRIDVAGAGGPFPVGAAIAALLVMVNPPTQGAAGGQQ